MPTAMAMMSDLLSLGAPPDRVVPPLPLPSQVPPSVPVLPAPSLMSGVGNDGVGAALLMKKPGASVDAW